MTTTLDIAVRPDQMVEMYSRYPQALAGRLHYIFGREDNEQDRTVHNFIVEEIQHMCPNRALLLSNVARAIIQTATQGDSRHGKAD